MAEPNESDIARAREIVAEWATRNESSCDDEELIDLEGRIATFAAECAKGRAAIFRECADIADEMIADNASAEQVRNAIMFRAEQGGSKANVENRSIRRRPAQDERGRR